LVEGHGLLQRLDGGDDVPAQQTGPHVAEVVAGRHAQAAAHQDLKTEKIERERLGDCALKINNE